MIDVVLEYFMLALFAIFVVLIRIPLFSGFSETIFSYPRASALKMVGSAAASGIFSSVITKSIMAMV